MAGFKINFDRNAVMQSLEENGYAVIPDVLPHDDCDAYIKEYKDWAKKVEESGMSWFRDESVIRGYKVGHFNASWNVRLKVKDVFAQIWQTDKLLTSVDSVALSPPPEEGSNQFAKPDYSWLHLDQGPRREGLHALQGAVYLEETTEEDYCFRVLAKSHKKHSDFIKAFPGFAVGTGEMEFYILNEEERKWYRESAGCQLVKVPAPKGGMVLWDSRTVHDNIRPEVGRKHKDRWRHVVFVCMTPAAWATSEDLIKKQNAYNDLLLTAHWPSRGVFIFHPLENETRICTVTELPEIAKSKDVRLLMGVDAYDFNDGNGNGPPPPKFRS